jgi:hypothetical protein
MDQRILAMFGSSSKPAPEHVGLMGFRDHSGQIVEVPVRVARVVDPKEMFK